MTSLTLCVRAVDFYCVTKFRAVDDFIEQLL